jgi:hypothetical protein
LITGDALVTVSLNSVWGLLTRKREMSGPPWYASWNWRLAKKSVATLAELEPQVVAGGHGIPISGPDTPGLVQAFSGRF